MTIVSSVVELPVTEQNGEELVNPFGKVTRKLYKY